MKKFIINFTLFVLFTIISGELIVRVFKLTSDIPHREIDEITGIQRYKKNQSGYYINNNEKWKVNEYGWLGISNVEKTIISLIGDSFIENIMNPNKCNQGYILQSQFANYSFFEAARSGVNFIESLEISKDLNKKIIPEINIIYVQEEDIKSSLISNGLKPDLLQLDLKNKKIIKAKLKYPILKKILYSFKLGYYMYLNFPLLIQNDEIISVKEENNEFNKKEYSNFFKYCSENYDLSNIIIIFHPNTSKTIIKMAIDNKFNVYELIKEKESWIIGNKDNHWSCYGHSQVASQVANVLKTQLK